MKNYKSNLLLKNIRLKKGITQAQLAQEIGETQSYISKYENCEQRLDLFEIEKICQVLDITLIEFVGLYSES